MADINLQEIHDNLVAIAFEAGEMITASNPNSIKTGTKLNSVDIVTETDQAVERHVSSRLSTLYPSFLFVGEETYIAGKTKITAQPTFIVDPIDGTTNFLHGFPHACISLGLAIDRVPAVGVIYNPFLDTMYTAIRGGGAYMQRNAALAAKGGVSATANAASHPSFAKIKLPPSSPPRPLEGLANALVAIEWGSSRDGPNYDLKTRVFRQLAASQESGGKMVHSLRSLGSAALNLCAVAAGEVDLYWEGGCYAWDVCAGWCILKEAGGVMYSGNPTTEKGSEFEPPALDARVYLAVRGAETEEGQKEVAKELWDVIGEEKMDYQH
ncbi:inositol monophosphatase 2 [Coniella lustricola]|uniref:Inositol-1-monophosphatase n=1 Tax=Coniella lustricola TaxID=2025994 RepID=A0A2T3AD17_9PEZI|nr:inositol monophosphatase 2 [Coniella lustricola]